MYDPQLIIRDEDYRRILAVLDRLGRGAQANGLFLVDKNGQLIAEAGDLVGLDTTSLASLAAGNVAATGSLAKLIGEEDFPTHYHEGRDHHLHITLLADRFILVVVFDRSSSLGLVRLRLKRAVAELSEILEQLGKAANHQHNEPDLFDELTEADIDNLFSD